MIVFSSVCVRSAALWDLGIAPLFAPYALNKFSKQVAQWRPMPRRSPLMLDCGAWSQKGGDCFDADRFRQLMQALPFADFVVLPDIVAGGRKSLERSLSWMGTTTGRIELLPAQDGLAVVDLLPFLGPSVGVFLGGTTSYKLKFMRPFGAAAKKAGAWFHVGRVNSKRRLEFAAIAGADSVDGSSPAQFPSTARAISKWAKAIESQAVLPW